MKILFVASDFSGLGKGAFSAALALVLNSHGVRTKIMKSDLYFNYDAGTINPQEHGEVYVLADGTEVDQDFGMYERFTRSENSALDYITSGRVFHQIYINEREGKYLGETVSTEHVIDEIKSRILQFAKQADVGIIELGATIGDIKGIYALEACRELISELGENSAAFILLSHFPFLENVQELKTMGCQRSVSALRAKGIQPDIVIARTPSGHPNVPDYQLGKLARYCGIPKDYVFPLPDLANEYEIPRVLIQGSLHQIVALQLGVVLRQNFLADWEQTFEKPKRVRIALVGKYTHADAYVSILQQLRFFGVSDVQCIPDEVGLENFDGVIIPGGWGKRGTEGLTRAARRCRRERIPTLGICLGLQIMLIDYARDALGLADANSAEFDPDTKHPVVVLQEEQKRISGLGGTSRLGNWTTILEPGSKLALAHGSETIVQRHRHRYEVSSEYNYKDFKITGRDQRTGLVEVMELADHPFYVGVQFHPEFSAVKNPVFGAFIEAVQAHKHPNANEVVSFPVGSGFPDSILPASTDEIRAISLLSESALHEKGISRAQQQLFKEVVRLLDERDAEMAIEENAVLGLERQMRDINLQPQRQDGILLTPSEKAKLAEFEDQINKRRAKIREARLRFEAEFYRIEARISRLGNAYTKRTSVE
jgi:CTP synthase